MVGDKALPEVENTFHHFVELESPDRQISGRTFSVVPGCLGPSTHEAALVFSARLVCHGSTSSSLSSSSLSSSLRSSSAMQRIRVTGYNSKLGRGFIKVNDQKS